MRQLMALALGVLCGCANAADLDAGGSEETEALAANLVNPVIPSDFADPSVMPAEGGFYAYSTNGGGGNVPVRFSRNLADWERRRDALPSMPAWASRGLTWAPDVSDLGGGRGYVLYFTARARAQGVQCVGVATSDNPGGPFTPRGDAPLICPQHLGGAIDASGFTDVDGQHYVVYKNDGNARGLHTQIFVQRTDAEGIHLIGDPVSLIRNDQPWEGAVVEAPFMRRHDHKYYLFYSANAYNNSSYTIGYAVSDSLMGGFVKHGQLAKSNNQNGPVIGPGGQHIFTTKSGEAYVAYHTWNPQMTIRPMSITRLRWNGDEPSISTSWGQRVDL